MAEVETKRSAGRYWSLDFVAFAAAFVVGLAVAYLAVWIMGDKMGEIEGAGKYVSIIASLVCAAGAYLLVLRHAFKYKPENSRPSGAKPGEPGPICGPGSPRRI